MTIRFLTSILIVPALLISGCSDKKPQPPLKSPAMPTATPAPAATPTAPVASQPNSTASSSSGPTVSALGASLTLPASWKRNPPANNMRLAEAAIPDASGDPAKACLVVFSSAGGTVEDNLARWSGQIRDAKGQPAKGATQLQTINGLKVSVINLNGTFSGMGDGAVKENWALHGAIVEAPEGLLFIKLTGPTASVAAADKDFDALIHSVKKP